MSEHTIFITFGTRPEAIKMAPVVLELQRRGIFRVVTCLTGQHREMLDQVVEAFSLPVDHDLKIMRDRQTLGHITSAVLNGIDPLLEAEKPALVMVHGDTTTTFAAALASYYRMIPVAHVEAGLRTENIYSPFPEEINRRLADRLAEVYYAPTTAAREALLREGARPDHVLVTGNTVIDALLVTAAGAAPEWEPKIARALERLIEKHPEPGSLQLDELAEEIVHWVLAVVVPVWALTAFAGTLTARRIGNRISSIVVGLTWVASPAAARCSPAIFLMSQTT